MPYFECVVASGGATLEVSYEEDFYGKTITVTNGSKTLVKTASSSGSVSFNIPESGLWTISGTVNGNTYSTDVNVSLEYFANLTAGFNYKAWLVLAALDPESYSSLADVLSDELAVHRLMTVHASSDYLIDAATDDISVIDDFVANDTAMKWIGLRDYVCDGLTAINGVEAKFLASQYWERYLKDHVPTMTANNAPYGTATALSNSSGAQAPYTTFDGVTTSTSSSYGASAGNGKTAWWGYQFTAPINVKKAKFIVWLSSSSKTLSVTAKIVGSNDGTNWTDVSTEQPFTINGQDLTPHEVLASDNADYYIYKRLVISSDDYLGISGQYALHITMLQFYGRSLDVSVPVMTSNTTPYGEAIGNGIIYSGNSYESYNAFKQYRTSGYAWNNGNTLIAGYDFGRDIKVKAFQICTYNYRGGKIQASKNGNTFTDLIADLTTVIPSITDYVLSPLITFDNDDTYKRYQIVANGGYLYGGCNFYGVDYSEREFEPNTNKKWLYDHGLELETFTTSGTVTKGDDYITLSAANSEATATVDLTSYDLLRGKVGDHMSGTSSLVVGSTATSTLTSANAPNNFSLDISAIDQTATVGAKMTANGVCDVTELWLE